MKRVKYREPRLYCGSCMDMAMSQDATPDCRECGVKYGEWIDTVSNFWGTYAIVQLDNGEIKKVSISSITVIDS